MQHIRARRWAALACVVGVLAAASAHAQYQEMHNFYWPTDGANPNQPAMLAQGMDGNLYGTLPTQWGGNGTAFECVLAATNCSSFVPTTFPQYNATPQSGLTFSPDGNLYGTTERGGTYGTIFAYSNGNIVTLYQFQNGLDGAYPWAPPVQALDGYLYGVTTTGNRPGTVYKIPTTGAPAGQLQVLGTVPETGTQKGSQAPLVPGGDGNLYGTTQYGGSPSCGASSNDRGTVFRVTTAGTVSTIFCFDGSAAKGGIPIGPVMWGTDGMLYGTTSSYGANGQGTVWQLDPNNPAAFKVLHHFSFADGTASSSGLMQGSDGMLYGVQSAGGTGSGCGVAACGTLYRVDPMKVDVAGTPNLQVLHTFDATYSEGANTYATPVLHTNGKIYGVSHTGGKTYKGYGALWRYDARLKPFALITPGMSVHPGAIVGIRGQGFLTSPGVRFGTNSSVTPPWKAVSDTYMLVQVPSTACTGHLTVSEPSGDLVTPQVLTVLNALGKPVPCISRIGISLP